MQTKWTIEELKARLTALHGWRARHVRPSERKRKHFRRWRQNIADTQLCEVFIEYLTVLGPDWYIRSGLPCAMICTEPGEEHDYGHCMSLGYARLDRFSSPLPEAALSADIAYLAFYPDFSRGYEYFVSDDPEVGPRFPTPAAAVRMALIDVERHYGPSLIPSV